MTRGAATGAVGSALGGIFTPAAAQHEHHGVPASSAQVALMGATACAEGTTLGGAIVQLFEQVQVALPAGGRHRSLRTLPNGSAIESLKREPRTPVVSCRCSSNTRSFQMRTTPCEPNIANPPSRCAVDRKSTRLNSS